MIYNDEQLRAFMESENKVITTLAAALFAQREISRIQEGTIALLENSRVRDVETLRMEKVASEPAGYPVRVAQKPSIGRIVIYHGENELDSEWDFPALITKAVELEAGSFLVNLTVFQPRFGPYGPAAFNVIDAVEGKSKGHWSWPEREE